MDVHECPLQGGPGVVCCRTESYWAIYMDHFCFPRRDWRSFLPFTRNGGQCMKMGPVRGFLHRYIILHWRETLFTVPRNLVRKTRLWRSLPLSLPRHDFNDLILLFLRWFCFLLSPLPLRVNEDSTSPELREVCPSPLSSRRSEWCRPLVSLRPHSPTVDASSTDASSLPYTRQDVAHRALHPHGAGHAC